MKKTKRCLALLIAMIMTATVCIGNGSVMAFADGTTEGVAVEESGSDTAESDNGIQSAEPDNAEETTEDAAVEESGSDAAESDNEIQSTELDNDEGSTEISEDSKYDDTPAIDSGETDNTGSNLDMAAVEEVVSLFEQLPEASEVESMSEDELNGVMQQTTNAINAFDGLEIDESDYFIENYPELYSAVMEDLSNALAALQQGDISTMSLLPLEEVEAYLVLNEKTDEELKSFSVDEMLNSLVDIEGNSISIFPSDATTVWRYIKDQDANVESYEKYSIGTGEKIDLTTEQNIYNYHLELIVGSGSQLNSDNVRYIVKVYVTNTVREELDYTLYLEESNGSRNKVTPERTFSAINNQIAEITANEYAVPECPEESQYYLGITSEADEHPDIRAEVYDFWEYLFSTNAQPITSRILNRDMEKSGEGIPIEYGVANYFAIVYFDKSNQLIGQSFVTFKAVADTSYINAGLYNKEGNELIDIVLLDAEHYGYEDIDSVFTDDGVHELCLMLKNGCSINSDIYCVLDAHGSTYGDDANSYVVKAVEGHYDSLDEASECEDIKDWLIPADKTFPNRGYKANYNYEDGGVPFTIFFEDGNIWKILVLAMEYDSKYDPDYEREYTDAPIIGESDPWFRVTGANDNEGNAYDTYIIENRKNINIDTMYGYGYQTVFINENVDSFVPTFWKADDESISIDRIYANGREFQEGSALSFPEGETTLDATFSVIITDKNGSHPKNYDVTFVKKTSGPQLYVAGPLAPDVRSVFLDEYHENKHDIFIANIGDAPLTDLWLDIDATNVELDDYWTIGGEGNNTLEACPDNFSLELDSTRYGELSNVAKIRLVPPSTGKGEIEGTLKIYSGKEGDAENSELLATIILSDLAQNPEITTKQVDDAVKYVPYSYLITTDNMYDWVNVSYELTEGSLPDGVELIEETGELYGVPQETGTFTFTVSTYFESTSENYAFDPSTVELTLTVNDNTDDNVFNATDSADNYSILDAIGTEATAGDHHYILEDYSTDQVFRSEGEFDQFVDVWLNGEKLEKGVDYTAEEGSTRITISAQTFENKANKNGERNTIAAEYRTSDPSSKNDSGNNNELKRTSQNFYIEHVEHTHSYDSGRITKAATCTEAGVRTYTCSCGSQYTESIPALGHNAGEGQITQELTCTQNGETSYYCIRCGVLMKTEITAATGHDYEITVTPGKDCATEGIRTGICRNCGDTYTERVPAIGHKYVAEVTTEPTETEDGLRTYICSACGDTFTEVIPALGDETHLHTYDEGVVTKEATCLENGIMTYTCTQCGTTKQETILASGHKFAEEVIEEATCLEPGSKRLTCEYCGDTYTERIPAAGHQYDNGVVTKEPTETETGIMTYTCTVCGSSYTEVIPMLNSDLAQAEAGNTGNVNGAVVNKESNSVQTGDETDIIFWLCLIAISLVAVTAGIVLRKRKY